MAEWRSQYCTTDNQYILFRIWVKETATNVIANTSTLSISVYAWRTNQGYTTNYGGGCNVKIDGVARGYQYWDWGECPISYDSDTFLYDESGIVIQHGSNGTKTINVAATCEWYANGSIYIDSSWQSFDITLTALDRSAPTVSVSTSNIGVSSFTINASSNVNCDRWDRSIDNGSTWTNFSTTNGTSASTTVTGLSPNTTYNVKVRARKTSNQVYGTSGTTSPKTIGNSILNSVNTVTADNATVQIGLNATVYVTSYTHKLVLKNGSTTILTKTGISLVNGNNTITLTSSERSTILNAMSSIKSFTGTFELTTWSGSTQIGSMTSKTATVQTTAANSAPTFTGFTYQDNSSTAVAVTENDQIMIQNVSTAKVTANAATAKNGASISSYSVAFGNLSASSTTTTITTGVITTTGTVTMTVSAIDSRGYSTSRTASVTVLAYTAIDITTYSIRRVNEVENTIQLSFSGVVKTVSVSDVDRNSITYCQYRFKKTSDSAYGSYVDILSSVTRSGQSFSFSNNALTSLDANYSWNVQILIKDALTNDTINLIVNQGIPLLSFRRQKMGINVKEPTTALDVNGAIKIRGSELLLDPASSSSDDSADIVFRYGNGQEKMRIWSENTPTASRGPNYRIYNSGGTQLFTGCLALGDGNGSAITVKDRNNGTATYLNYGASAVAASSITYLAVWNGYELRGMNKNQVLLASQATSAATGSTVCWRDGNGDTRFRYAYTTNVNQSSPDQTTSLDYGQYMIYCNSDGWLRKAKHMTTLYSGTLKNGTQASWANVNSYSFYLIIGTLTGNAEPLNSILVTRSMLGTSQVRYQYADESLYNSFYLWLSGTTGYIKGASGSNANAYVKWVIGLN